MIMALSLHLHSSPQKSLQKRVHMDFFVGKDDVVGKGGMTIDDLKSQGGQKS